MAELIELGSILHMEKGKKPKEQVQTPTDGYLPYVDIKAFEEGIINSYATTENCLTCEDGDLLIVCDGSRSGLTGIAIKGVVGSTLSKIYADGMTTKYLQYYIQSKYILLNTRKKGTGTPHLNAEILKKSKLIVPPIAEQERIVAKIEELFSQSDKAIQTLQTVKQQLSIYRQSVLKSAFDSINQYAPLGCLTDKIFDGPFGTHLKTADYTDNGVRVVRLENLKDGWFDDSKKSYVTPEKYMTISNHTVYPTDLIMSTFIADSIKICQMPISVKYAVNKADCIGIRLNKNYLQKYVMFYMLTKEAYNSLANEIHGATRPRVNTTQIKKVPIPVCDLQKQQQIVSEIESRLSVCDSIEKTVDDALLQAEALRQSILKQAFEGELI